MLELSELPPSSCPWLIYQRNGGQIFHNVSENHSLTTRIPYLQNKYVWSSCHGWWVVKDFADQQCFILNPLSLERIELPELEGSIDYAGCILTNSPKNSDCRVLLFCRCDNYIFSCRIGDAKFKKQRVVADEGFASVTVARGIIYGLLTYTLVSVSVEGNNIKIKKVIDGVEENNLSTPETFRTANYLVESNNDLLHVHVSYYKSFYWEVEGFKVFKMSPSGSEWEEVKSIGKRALFLDDTSAMCYNVEEDDGVEENNIYYVGSHSHHINVFDLQSGSVHRRSWTPSTVANYCNHMFRWVRLPSSNNL